MGTDGAPIQNCVLSQFLREAYKVRAEVYAPCAWTALPSGRGSVQTSATTNVWGAPSPLTHAKVRFHDNFTQLALDNSVR